MRTTSTPTDKTDIPERHALQALGVLMPIRLSPLKFLPGRHPLGRAGSGLRFLRTRRFEQGEDNPRDIDKFSPPDERRVIEWEEESQASIALLADLSASMAIPFKASLRNACLLQLTYSLWRAGDRVSTTFFSTALHQEIRAANLKNQMEKLGSALSSTGHQGDTDIGSVLEEYLHKMQRRVPDMLFVVSDFVKLGREEFTLDYSWRRALNQFRHNLIPVIVTFQVPDGIRGMVKLWDPERNVRRLAWLSSSRVRRINAEERDRVAMLTRNFRAAGLDYLVVTSQREIYPQLAQLARIRRRRKN